MSTLNDTVLFCGILNRIRFNDFGWAYLLAIRIIHFSLMKAEEIRLAVGRYSVCSPRYDLKSQFYIVVPDLYFKN